MNFIHNIITAHISHCKIAFSFENKIFPNYALIFVCLLLFTRCIISQNSLKYPYMLPSENLNFSNRSYRFHVETSYITLNVFYGCCTLTCCRSYQRSLYCVVIYENYCNMDSLTRYVARHFRIVLLPCSRK